MDKVKNRPDMKLVLSEERILSRVKELARTLDEEYAGRNLLLVGVLNGAFIFLADLAKNMTIPVEIDFIRVASYGAESESSGQITMTKDVETVLKGRDVLIVEDIADSGLTMNWLRNHFHQLGAASTRICVLIDKLERRETPVELDYVGFEISTGFLIGYGMDFNGQYRHLPQIYHLIFPESQENGA